MEVNPYIIYITFPDQIWAEKIVALLLEKKLIACANIHAPCQSLYQDNGTIVKTAEIIAVIKTVHENYNAIVDLVNDHHPYECPCIIGWAMTAINAPYKSWLTGQISL